MNEERQKQIEHERKLVSKCNELRDLVKDNLHSLENINSLFSFEGKQNTKLKKEGHEILSRIGLLRSNGGVCLNCSKNRNLTQTKKGDGLQWKCNKCKKTTKSIRHGSIFSASKKSIYIALVIIHQFSARSKSKDIINLLNVSDKTVAEWTNYLRNAQTRILLQVDLTIGGKEKNCVADETYVYRPPKQGIGKCKEYWRNWLVVIVEKDSTKFVCRLIGKRTRPAIESIIHEYVKVGTTIKTDEHKAYYWLGKTTSARTFQPCRPALHIHKKYNHSVGFKAYDGTHTNEIEGQNNLIKHPYKAMSGLPKSKLPQFLDQLMFEGWVNSVLPYSEESHSRAERDKAFNNYLMFIVALTELYCSNEEEWFFEHDFVADGGKVKFSDELYLFYKDQGYAKDENDVPEDDVWELDTEFKGYDFSLECDDSDDSDYV